MKILGIIPARYASSRFPGKPLADIAGKSMIQRVYEQASKASLLTDVVVATDDQRIFDHVNLFGKAVMTSESHANGTERCKQALTLSGTYDYVVNIQGDEPFIHPEQIDMLCGCLDKDHVPLATLIKRIDTQEVLLDPSTPKVIIDSKQNAIYFSRQTIPFLRDIPQSHWLNHHTFYKHIGIYAYRADVLSEIVKLEPTTLELQEKLEQLRWIENGYSVKTVVTPYESEGIDTPEDLEKVLKKIAE